MSTIDRKRLAFVVIGLGLLFALMAGRIWLASGEFQEVRGTVIRIGELPTETGDGQYMIVALPDGAEVRVPIRRRVATLRGRTVILHVSERTLLGRPSYTFKEYLPEDVPEVD